MRSRAAGRCHWGNRKEQSVALPSLAPGQSCCRLNNTAHHPGSGSGAQRAVRHHADKGVAPAHLLLRHRVRRRGDRARAVNLKVVGAAQHVKPGEKSGDAQDNEDRACGREGNAQATHS